MVHYIRLLRTPQVAEVSKKGIAVTAVAAVTTDLGDAFLAAQTALVARLVDATNTGEILFATDLQWNVHSRAVKLNLVCPDKLVGRLVVVHVTTRETIASLNKEEAPSIMDIWSETFTLKSKQRTEPLVERRIPLAGKSKLRMLEETGDSIARHVWYVTLVEKVSCY